ncbi:MAG: FSR family fosmidomycin resistance protein-like MFS transporter, partial [Candidatus Poriferisodalaceae bacterium]
MFVKKNHKLFILTVFVSAHVVNDFYVTVLPAFLPALSDEFNLDYGELGILSLTFTLLSGVLQPIFGHRADRYGQRRLIVSVGFLAGAPSFWFLIAVSLLCGLGGASYHPQATAFIVSRYPDDRGRMLGIHGWGGSVGHFLAPAAVTISVAAFSWRFSMLVIALPLALMALFLRFSLEESEPSSSVTLTGVMTKELIRVAVAFGLLSVVMRSFLTFAVKMLVDEGWTGQGAGLALSSVLLVGTLAQPIGGRIYDRIGGRTVFMYAIVGTILSVACFAVSNGAMSLVA